MEYTVAPPRKPKAASKWRNPVAEEAAKQKARDRQQIFGLGEEYKCLTSGVKSSSRMHYKLMSIELEAASMAAYREENSRESLADAEWSADQ